MIKHGPFLFVNQREFFIAASLRRTLLPCFVIELINHSANKPMNFSLYSLHLPKRSV